MNGSRICTAGVKGRGVLSAITTWVERVAHDPNTGDPIEAKFEEELTLDVGGLAQDHDGANVHLKWFGRALHIGDEIRIKVIRASHVDEPKTRKREDPDLVEKQKRRYYERLKREYGE